MSINDANTPKRRRGRPSQEIGNAHALIRATALREFARAGFAGVSIADIAQAAGVAKPLIHYHFESKDALWEAAVSEGFSILQRDLASFRELLPTEGTTSDTLRQIAHQLVRYAARYPELTRIVINESGLGGSRSDWLSQKYLLPGYRLAQLGLNLFRHTHTNPNTLSSPEHMIPVVLGVMNFPFLESKLLHEAFGTDVQSDAYLDKQGDVLFTVIQTLL